MAKTDNATVILLTPLQRHILGYALYCIGGFRATEQGDFLSQRIPQLVLSLEEYTALVNARNIINRIEYPSIV